MDLDAGVLGVRFSAPSVTPKQARVGRHVNGGDGVVTSTGLTEDRTQAYRFRSICTIHWSKI